MDDAKTVADLMQYWKPILEQMVALACYKRGSDEIVGLNMNYVIFKDEHFLERLIPQVYSKIDLKIIHIKIFSCFSPNKLIYDIFFLIFRI